MQMLKRLEEGIGDATVEDEEDVNAGTKSGMGVAVGQVWDGIGAIVGGVCEGSGATVGAIWKGIGATTRDGQMMIVYLYVMVL